MKGGSDGLVVERLDGELLVYDTESSEAHRLEGKAAAAFAAASSDVSRREVLRKLALAGAGAALVTTVVAPTAAQAQSPACTPGDPTTCGPAEQCLACNGTPGCFPAGSYCCGANTCSFLEACCNGACVANSNTQCGVNCGNCTTVGGTCTAGLCFCNGLLCT
jgi:hypothetical protein